jgi:hypothetical protein
LNRFLVVLLFLTSWTVTDHAAAIEPVVIGCRQDSTIRVRIRLFTPTGPLRALTKDIRLVVDEVWRGYGVTMEWEEINSTRDPSNVDVLMLARYSRIAGHPTALGGVTFTPNTRTQLAQLSLGAALELVQRSLPIFRRVRGPLRGQPTLDLGVSGAHAARLVGYAASHELGHLLLGSKTHSSTGLMVANYGSFQRFVEPGSGSLDTGSHKRLLKRLEGIANCRTE